MLFERCKNTMRSGFLATIVANAISLRLALASQNLPKVTPLFDCEGQNQWPLGSPSFSSHVQFFPRSAITDPYQMLPDSQLYARSLWEHRPRELAGKRHGPDRFEPDRAGPSASRAKHSESGNNDIELFRGSPSTRLERRGKPSADWLCFSTGKLCASEQVKTPSMNEPC